MAVYRYWPLHKPIPEGWILSHDLSDTHHGVYSVLIKQVSPDDTSHASPPAVTSDGQLHQDDVACDIV